MKPNKWLSTLLACSALALSACGGGGSASPAASAPSSPAAASEPAGKVYRVAMNAQFPPFESLQADGKIVGFDVDILDAMAKAGNFQVEYRSQPWDGLFNLLKNGDVDILISGITINEERKQSYAFTEPYFTVTQVVLLPGQQNISSVQELNSLNRVGVTNGTTADLAAGKIMGPTNPKIARFENLPLLLKEIENGGIEAAIADSAVIAEYLRHNSNKGFRILEVPDFEAEQYGIMVRKDDAETLARLNRALADIRASGEYDRIYAQYFGAMPAAASASEATASAASAQ